MSTLESIFLARARLQRHASHHSGRFPWGCRRLNWLTRHDQRQIGMQREKIRCYLYRIFYAHSVGLSAIES